MANELIINASLPETRIALMEDGEIQELLIERASGKGIVGNIYKGRVTRVLPGMQAAFVDIGLEKAAFLYVDDVYVHPEVWEEEEGQQKDSPVLLSQADMPIPELAAEMKPEEEPSAGAESAEKVQPESQMDKGNAGPEGAALSESDSREAGEEPESLGSKDLDLIPEELSEGLPGLDEDDEDEDEDPVKMGPDPDDSQDGRSGSDDANPVGTIAPESSTESSDKTELSASGSKEEPEEATSKTSSPSSKESSESALESPDSGGDEGSSAEASVEEGGQARRRHRRGRRGGKFRSQKGSGAAEGSTRSSSSAQAKSQAKFPDSYEEQVADPGNLESDRAELSQVEQQSLEALAATRIENLSKDAQLGRPVQPKSEKSPEKRVVSPTSDGSEFRAQRSRDRRIRPKATSRPMVQQVNIQDLLKEGQEVLVQVAKDPIATKGARLTCHISLPGRHLVCMPTIDHVGVSRRIERDEERRRLREYVEKNRPRNLGFIVRTASGKQQSEKRIKQDIDYLTRLWTEIREKAGSVTAPALVYEDLNAVLRAVRDWVTEETDKVIVDSRYHFNEIQRFVSHFMPALKQKVELYHGDIPIFDAYGISTELSRGLERKVWLKSGGYIVIDQAEALVAIDVNTGRYVGKKNLEDTILKTNLEAVQEIAYQLRLRNCGGIIILDLIDMEKEENKQRVYRTLEEALQRDRARPTILKISELGLVEMTRKRTRDTIVRALCESCPHCEGKGFIKSRQTVAYEVMRELEREGIDRDVSKVLVQAHPDVIDILAIDERDALDQLERRYRKSIYLQAVLDFHPEQFEVTADKKERSEQEKSRGKEHSSREDRSSNIPYVASGAEKSHHSRNRESSKERGRDREKGKDRDRSRGERNQEGRGKQEGGSSSRSGAAQTSVKIVKPQVEGSSSIPKPLPVIKPVTSASNPASNKEAGQESNGLAGNSPSEKVTKGDDVSGSASGNVAGAGLNPGNVAIPGQGVSGTGVSGSGNSGTEVSRPGVSGPATPIDDSIGNVAEKGSSPLSLADPTEDGFYDEEDRLAFLRAQAAQDAALARLNSGGLGSHSSRGGESARADRNGKNRNHMRNRKGSGKFRRGNEHPRDRDRGGKYFAGGNGPVPKAPKPNEPRMPASSESPAPSPIVAKPSGTGSASGGTGSSGTGGIPSGGLGGSGSGEHSTPLS